ncbi:MAG: hypothetical protein Q4E47_01495 [Candidatus Saccharibacteria bacterium]|nr:hypothetical protein [Candidatus Saccharibacteria bacterium]
MTPAERIQYIATERILRFNYGYVSGRDSLEKAITELEEDVKRKTKTARTKFLAVKKTMVGMCGIAGNVYNYLEAGSPEDNLEHLHKILCAPSIGNATETDARREYFMKRMNDSLHSMEPKLITLSDLEFEFQRINECIFKDIAIRRQTTI